MTPGVAVVSDGRVKAHILAAGLAGAGSKVPATFCGQLRIIYYTGLQRDCPKKKGLYWNSDHIMNALKKTKSSRFHSKLSEPGEPASGARALDASLGVIVAPVGVVPVQGAPPRAALVPRAAPRQDQSKDNDDDKQQHTAASVDVFHRQDENPSR